MTSDEIIKMIKQAGVPDRGHPMFEFNVYLENFERFAALVAAAEREACELIVDNLIISGSVSEVQQRRNWAYMHARDAIRARGET